MIKASITLKCSSFIVSKISLAKVMSSKALFDANNSLSVVFPKAETMMATFCSLDAFSIIAKTFLMFSELATDEPPNFNTFILNDRY